MMETKKAKAKGSASSDGILSNHVETDRKLLDGVRSSPGFRGDLLFAPPLILGPDSARYAEVAEACAPKAITVGRTGLTLDKGRCVMCGLCQELAPDVFRVENGFAHPKTRRQDLVVAQLSDEGLGTTRPPEEIGRQLSDKIRRVLGRSLAIREVDAGSCNGCEVEVVALNNPVYDVERFGVHFVASPRHADVLLVTGVGSRNMELALRRTYEATPDPKVVVAVGACACSGGVFGDTYASSGGIGKIVPVDVYVPGCPPRPEAILYGLLLAVERIG